VHPPGQAFKAGLTSIHGARIDVAALCCGMGVACLQSASDRGSQRRTFGKTLHEHRGWRWNLADAAIDLEAARFLSPLCSRCRYVDCASQGRVSRDPPSGIAAPRNPSISPYAC